MSSPATQEEPQVDMTPGTFTWNELATSDAAGSTEFYTKLFGWETMKVPGMDHYTMMMVGDRMVAGIMDKSAQCDGPPMWLSYVTVSDVKASLAKAVELGAEEFKGVTEIPGKGSFAIIKDPQGGMIALWEYSAQPTC